MLYNNNDLVPIDINLTVQINMDDVRPKYNQNMQIISLLHLLFQ